MSVCYLAWAMRQRLRRRWSPNLLIVFALVVVTAIVAGCSSADELPDLPPNPIPRLIVDWAARADKLEASLRVDSRPLIARPEYADSEAFLKLLGEQVSAEALPAGADADSLERDLRSMAQQLEQRIARLPAQTGPNAAADDEERRALTHQQTQLVALARRLAELRNASKSSTKQLDAAATAELVALRELETAAQAKSRVELSATTRRRGHELFEAANGALAKTAWHALLRAGDERGIERAAKQLPRVTAERQVELCWSLLIAGSGESIAAAIDRLQAAPELVDQLPRPALLELIDAAADRYVLVLPVLIARSRSPDERWAWFKIQCQVWQTAWDEDVRRAFDNGLLRQQRSAAVVEIVGRQRTRAYGVAESLLATDPHLQLDELSEGRLPALLPTSPVLATRLAEHWLLAGNAAQRQAAVVCLADERAVALALTLWERIDQLPLDRPSALLNLLLPTTSDKVLAVAEHVVQRLQNSRERDEIASIRFAKASSVALGRAALSAGLVDLAWSGDRRAQSWALLQLLGAADYARLDEARERQRQQRTMIDIVAPLLEGKLVIRTGAAKATDDRALAIPVRELPKLPTDITASTWDHEHPAARELSELATRLKKLSAAEANDDPRVQMALMAITAQVDDWQQLTAAAYQIAAAYDATVTQQLPGAKRELLKRRLETWEFRFTVANVERFTDHRQQAKILLKQLEAREPDLPLDPGVGGG